MTPRARARPRLNRRTVLDAALALVDREGAKALSMRRLGQELGVEAMSLYTYLANRDELLDGLSEIMVEALPQNPAVADWRDGIRAFAHGIRATAEKHPQAFRLVGMRPLKTTSALNPVEMLLSTLRRSGFNPLQAVSAYRLVAAYARGFALAEIEGFTLDHDSNTSPETRTAIAEARATPDALDHNSAFTSGLETIVTGLAAQIASHESRRR
ncbi:MAG TPA: TetR/AcrR family transcriptional regulator C-terminal domain-containing protein [Gaiellaceae bacterium]